MPISSIRRWRDRLIRLQVAALGAAAVGVAARWALAPAPGWLVPPGVVILAGAAALLLFRRRALTIAVGVTAAALVAGRILSRPAALEGLGHGASGAAETLEAAGVILALVSGLAALLLTARISWTSRRAAGQPVPWLRGAQVVGLLLLAPVCAEYLAAYDSSTGHPAQLLGGLLIFVPLYGCPALLIRETARRAGLGSTGILLLGTAFGLLQAGVVDQSLFSPDYRAIEGWSDGFRATLIAPLGISVFNLLSFVGGHALFSIGAPVALVEAARPQDAGRPWLSRGGLAVTAALYLAASGLVLSDHLSTETSHASSGQIIASVGAVLLLIAAALRRRRPRGPVPERSAPAVLVVFAAALVLAAVNGFAAETWTGVAQTLATYGLAFAGLLVFSARPGWSGRHVAVVAAAPLLVRGVLAFTYPPLIGEVADAAKYGHNAVMLGIVLVALAIALRPATGSRTGGVGPGVDTVGSPDRRPGRTAG